MGFFSRLVFACALLGLSSNTLAEGAWTHHKTGHGTAFENRWTATTAIESMSSDETLASDMYLGANLYDNGGLFFWVTHASSELCEFSKWKLAIDKTVIPIEPELSEDTEATALHPANDAESVKLRKLFREGERAAVRFHANCGNMFYLNYIGTATMTYSLNGSSAALQFLEGNVLETAEEEQRPKDIEAQREENEQLRRDFVAENSPDLAAYIFAISQKIRRSWAVPASAKEDTVCVVHVRQTRHGDVTSVDIVSCNGDDAVSRSVEAAVLRASPLPRPSNPDLFRAELRIALRPDL